MQISDVDDFGLRVYNTVKRHRILPVDISLSSGSLLVTVGKDAQQPPYRIENRSATQLVTGRRCCWSCPLDHPNAAQQLFGSSLLYPVFHCHCCVLAVPLLSPLLYPSFLLPLLNCCCATAISPAALTAVPWRCVTYCILCCATITALLRL